MIGTPTGEGGGAEAVSVGKAYIPILPLERRGSRCFRSEKSEGPAPSPRRYFDLDPPAYIPPVVFLTLNPNGF